MNHNITTILALIINYNHLLVVYNSIVFIDLPILNPAVFVLMISSLIIVIL